MGLHRIYLMVICIFRDFLGLMGIIPATHRCGATVKP